MVTVRKHSTRRVHSYQGARGPANPPQARNKKRIAAGLRPIHSHQNANVVELGRGLSSYPEKAIFGWLRTMVSKMSADMARKESRDAQRHDRNVKVHEVTREARSAREQLTRYARAKHQMQYLVADLLPVNDKIDKEEDKKTRFRKAHYWCLPTSQHVYTKITVDDNSHVPAEATENITSALADAESRDGLTVVIIALSALTQVNDKYASVLQLIQSDA